MAEINLRLPGPTPCPDEVARAVSGPMMNYRGPEMAELLGGLLSKLKRFLDTSYEVLLLTAGGTAGLEAAIVNTLSPGDRVVGANAGVFGKRFLAVARAFGAGVRAVDVAWGSALDPETLRRVLREERRCRAVLLTHNETSTGIAHPVEALVAVVKEETDALVLVDAVSSLGAMPLPMDRLAIDVVISGSQKAWGVPPGMAILCLGPRAWEAASRATMPRFYFDLLRYRDAQARGSFPFTPALPVVYGLGVALDLLLRETPEGVFARHLRIAERVRQCVRELGLELFADPAHASPTVTAIRVPEGVDERVLLERLRTRYKTVLARGQDKLAGKIVRLGHLGFVEEPEIDAALDALGRTLVELGYTAR